MVRRKVLAEALAVRSTDVSVCTLDVIVPLSGLRDADFGLRVVWMVVVFLLSPDSLSTSSLDTSSVGPVFSFAVLKRDQKSRLRPQKSKVTVRP